MTDDRPANRLAAERSPYLQQHGHNPVDWYPWGAEALARAESLDRPIFLSVGYSACHWCHVMERESFEDIDVSEVLNANFVCIKVDREERPDIDQTYQLAHQVLARRGGGWPLSVFLTPALQPFYTGTYFPTPKRDGMPSFVEVLRAILDAWRNRRRDVDAQAEEVTLALMQEASLRESPDDPDRAWLPTAVRALLGRVDPEHGGFGRAPKFPNTMSLDLLATAAVVDPEGVGPAARAAVDRTLDAMARGGIWDHLGGGFARYSVDAVWRVPHFEKMLYDNAQLLRVYAAAARGADGLRADRVAVASDIVGYLAREMTSPEGAYYSAQDADSEGEEGRFFTWSPGSIRAVVGDDAPAVCAWYDVTPEGNFEHGRSVLWTPRSPTAVAEALGLTESALADVVARARPRLFAAREARPKPLRDDKCIAAWNGLALGALADAGATLARWELVERAESGLRAWHDRAWRDERLAHAMKDGVAYGVGFLDDHAALAGAAVDVWEAGGGAWCLAWARALMAQVLARFVDDDEGGVFYTPSDAEVVLVRSKDPTDHAYPGGVGLCLDALQRLAAITGERRLRDVARRLTAQYGPTSREHPIGMATVLLAADRGARGATEVILVGERGSDAMRAMVHAAHGVPVAHRVVVSCAGVADAVEQGVDRELIEGRACRDDGAPMAYVCQGTTCEMPVHTPDALRGVLSRLA